MAEFLFDDRIRVLVLEQVSADKPFRKLAEMLGSVAYSHIVPELVREPRPRAGRDTLHAPRGTEWLSSIAKLPQEELRGA